MVTITKKNELALFKNHEEKEYFSVPDNLYQFFTRFKKYLYVTSAGRTAERNKQVGGSPNSYHLIHEKGGLPSFYAIDFHVFDSNIYQVVKEYLEKMKEEKKVVELITYENNRFHVAFTDSNETGFSYIVPAILFGILILIK